MIGDVITSTNLYAPRSFVQDLGMEGAMSFYDQPPCIHLLFQQILVRMFKGETQLISKQEETKNWVKLQSWLACQLELYSSAFCSSWSAGGSKSRELPAKISPRTIVQSMACTTLLTESTLMTAILKSLTEMLITLQYNNVLTLHPAKQMSQISFYPQASLFVKSYFLEPLPKI